MQKTARMIRRGDIVVGASPGNMPSHQYAYDSPYVVLTDPVFASAVPPSVHGDGDGLSYTFSARRSIHTKYWYDDYIYEVL